MARTNFHLHVPTLWGMRFWNYLEIIYHDEGGACWEISVVQGTTTFTERVSYVYRGPGLGEDRWMGEIRIVRCLPFRTI